MSDFPEEFIYFVKDKIVTAIVNSDFTAGLRISLFMRIIAYLCVLKKVILWDYLKGYIRKMC